MSQAEPLHAFSVRQPWASLLVAGVKRYEVRTWRPKHAGPYLVHASSGKAGGIRELREQQWFRRALSKADLDDESGWPQSAIIGMVEIVEFWRPGRVPPRLTQFDRNLCGSIRGMYLWQAGMCWRFRRPVPCDGKLNVWVPPANVLGAVGRRLTERPA